MMEKLMEKRLELDITFPFWVAYVANLQIVRWSAFQIAVSAVFPLVGLYLSYIWITQQHVPDVAEVLILVACFFFKPLVTLLALFLARRKNPLSTGPFRYIFDAEGIHASGAAFNTSLKWAAIQKVRESSSFIFFFIAPGRAQAIAANQLRVAGILDNVRELARQHVADTKLRNAQQAAAGDARNART